MTLRLLKEMLKAHHNPTQTGGTITNSPPISPRRPHGQLSRGIIMCLCPNPGLHLAAGTVKRNPKQTAKETKFRPSTINAEANKLRMAFSRIHRSLRIFRMRRTKKTARLPRRPTPGPCAYSFAPLATNSSGQTTQKIRRSSSKHCAVREQNRAPALENQRIAEAKRVELEQYRRRQASQQRKQSQMPGRWPSEETPAPSAQRPNQTRKSSLDGTGEHKHDAAPRRSHSLDQFDRLHRGRQLVASTQVRSKPVQVAPAHQPKRQDHTVHMRNEKAAVRPASKPKYHDELPNCDDKTKTRQSFKEEKCLGQGAFGDVFKMTEIATGATYAIKIINKQCVQERKGGWQAVKKEIHILQTLGLHQSIAGLHCWFQDDENIYFVLDFVDGRDLWENFLGRTDFGEQRTAYYIKKITEALKHTHSKNVIHRDLKPENILLGLDGEVRLADFGCSIIYDEDQLITTMEGTITYMAPEIFPSSQVNHRVGYDTRSDIWSLGVLAFELMTGISPFDEETDRAVMERITRGDRREFPRGISQDAKHFIQWVRGLSLMNQNRTNLSLRS